MNREGILIGTVKGPGETPSEFKMIAPDPEQLAKFGEFVYFRANNDPASAIIFGRVTQRETVRLWPDEFMANPGVSPDRIAQLLGFRGLGPGPEPDIGTDLYALTVAIMGRFDEQLRDFINPRIAPSSGTRVYLATNAQLIEVLSTLPADAEGSAYVGDLISRPRRDVPIVLDVSQFTSTHLAIIASTGSGKSYLAGVLLEELMSPKNRAAALVVDPHGEYDTLQEMMNLEQFRRDGYRPQVRILHPDEVKVRIDSLTLADLIYFLPNLSEKMQHHLSKAHRKVQRDKAATGAYTLNDLIQAVQGSSDSEDGGSDRGTVQALEWRLESTLGRSDVFNDHRELELPDLFRPGQCTVLQINEIEPQSQQVIVATILRRAYDARKATVKSQASAGDKDFLNYPIFCLLEEAHNFSPANNPVVTSRVLKTILSEGRKFGVSIGLISQRPGRLDSDVLSQCMTQCIMRIINPTDQARIAESVESVGRDLLQELPNLSKGQAVVTGASINTPVLLNVRPRITRHGGQDINAPQEWVRYYQSPDRDRERLDAQSPHETMFDDNRVDGVSML